MKIAEFANSVDLDLVVKELNDTLCILIRAAQLGWHILKIYGKTSKFCEFIPRNTGSSGLFIVYFKFHKILFTGY